jgi:hypothetical protein
MTGEPLSPYCEGQRAAEVAPSRGQPNCPYPDADPRHDEWYEGFGDATEELIAWNGGEFDVPD